MPIACHSGSPHHWPNVSSGRQTPEKHKFPHLALFRNTLFRHTTLSQSQLRATQNRSQPGFKHQHDGVHRGRISNSNPRWGNPGQRVELQKPTHHPPTHFQQDHSPTGPSVVLRNRNLGSCSVKHSTEEGHPHFMGTSLPNTTFWYHNHIMPTGSDIRCQRPSGIGRLDCERCRLNCESGLGLCHERSDQATTHDETNPNPGWNHHGFLQCRQFSQKRPRLNNNVQEQNRQTWQIRL